MPAHTNTHKHTNICTHIHIHSYLTNSSLAPALARFFESCTLSLVQLRALSSSLPKPSLLMLAPRNSPHSTCEKTQCHIGLELLQYVINRLTGRACSKKTPTKEQLDCGAASARKQSSSQLSRDADASGLVTARFQLLRPRLAASSSTTSLGESDDHSQAQHMKVSKVLIGCLQWPTRRV